MHGSMNNTRELDTKTNPIDTAQTTSLQQTQEDSLGNLEFDFGHLRAPRVILAIQGILGASPESLFDPRSLLDETSGLEDKKMLLRQINNTRGTFARNGYELHQITEQPGIRAGRPRLLGYYAEKVGSPEVKTPRREEPRRTYKTVDDKFTLPDGTIVEGYRARTLQVLSGTSAESQLTITDLIERVLGS